MLATLHGSNPYPGVGGIHSKCSLQLDMCTADLVQRTGDYLLLIWLETDCDATDRLISLVIISCSDKNSILNRVALVARDSE